MRIKSVLSVFVLAVLFSSCGDFGATKKKGAKIKGKIYSMPAGSGWENGPTPKDNEMIYLVSMNNPSIKLKKKTGKKGEFKFKNLPAGDYKLFVYSKNSINHKKDSIVEQIVRVNAEDGSFKAGKFLIYN